MKLDELLQSLPSREDIADAVGFHSAGRPASSAGDVLPALAIFGTGMMIGAGLALLFAPKDGAGLRSDLARTAESLGDQVRELAAGAAKDGASPAGEA